MTPLKDKLVIEIDLKAMRWLAQSDFDSLRYAFNGIVAQAATRGVKSLGGTWVLDANGNKIGKVEVK